MKKILFFLVAGLAIIPFAINAQAPAPTAPANQAVISANMAPRLYVTDVQITSTDNNKITGTFTAANAESYFMADLNYEIRLFKGTDFKTMQLIDTVNPAETFFIKPVAVLSPEEQANLNGPNFQTVVKSFTYNYPQGIASGDYTLRVQIITGRGQELGWQDKVITLKGNGQNFLNIFSDSSKVIDGKTTGFPLEGINVKSTDDVIGSMKVQNSGNAVTVVPHVKIFQRQVNMPVVKEYQDSAITFAKGETKDVQLLMPKLDKPESYLAEVKFYQGNSQVSGIQYFRWVVEGASGKIIYLKADKDFYKAGESINLTIESVGPADASDLGMGKLQVTVSDSSNKIIGQVEKDVALNFSVVDSNIVIPVTANLVSPIIDAKLLKDTNLLDERTINMPAYSAEAKQIQSQTQNPTTKSNNGLAIILIIAFLIIAISMVSAFLVLHKKK